MVTSYAETKDLVAWLPGETPPASAARFLRSASFDVARAANRNIYTDTPSDADAVVLRDATCAQAASWILTGVDPAKGGTDRVGPVKASTILDARVERDTTVAAEAAREAVGELACEARAILEAAGLLYVAAARFDDTGRLPSWGTGYPRYADWVAGCEWPLYE